VFQPEKIEEWIQEIKERPSSAPLVIQYIASRLQDLSEWNEKLRTENLELRSGHRVAEYERRIAHLEYQLELLKRQVDGTLDLGQLAEISPKLDTEMPNLLVYGAGGRVSRIEMDPSNFEVGELICSFKGIQEMSSEPPRILMISPTEELMLIFTSGRIVTMPAISIPLNQEPEETIHWQEAYIPEEPNLGETLACIAPISKIALADFFLQISRRGYAKKIRKALAPTIMGNKFIGTGVKVPADQTLTLSMSHASENYVLVSYEGYIQVIPERLLPYGIVEAMRLGKTDHLEAAFPAEADESILVMTQIGKVIHRTADSLNTTTDLQRKGSMLYSTTRRSAGVRVVGAAVVDQGGWGLALHSEGQVTLHAISDLIGTGSIPVEGELLDFIAFYVPEPMKTS
jgi:DNA gyrase/topoisomerase IV subunit A